MINIIPFRTLFLSLFFLYIVLFLSLFYSLEANAEEREPALTHLQQGSAFLFSGKLDLAEKEFQEALAIDPKLHPAYFGLGLIYLKKNSPEKAEKSFQSAIALKPDYAPAFRGLGEVGELKKDLTMAVTAYQKAVFLGKDQPGYAGDLAISRFRLSQIGETPEMALMILEHNRLGKLLLKEKKKGEALEEFSKIFGLLPTNLDALENSAVILSDLGKFEDSARLLQRIIAIDPEILFAHYLLGLIDETLEKYGEAWEEYNFIVLHGEKRAQQNEVVKAKEKIKELGSSHEMAVEIARKLKEASSLSEKGELDQGEKLYREILREAPENSLARFGLGLVAFSRKRFDEAEQIFLPLAEKNPEMLLVHFYLGKIYLSEKEIEKAFARLNQVEELKGKGLNAEKYKTEIEESRRELEQYGNNLAVGTRVGLLLKEGLDRVKKEDFDQAKEKFKQVLDLSPQNLEAMENLALIYMRITTFDPQKARALFEKMLSIRPDILFPMFSLGGLLENQGEIKEAMEQYQKASARDPKEGGYGERARKRIHQMGGTPERAEILYALLKEGGRLLNEKKWDLAAETYQKTVQIVPDQIEALYSLSLISVQRKENEKAEGYLRSLLAVDPENLEAHFQLGVLLGAIGRYEDAAKELEIVVAKGKEGRIVQSARDEMEKMGKKGDAEGYFQNGVELLKQIEEINKKGPFSPEDPVVQKKKELVEKAVEEFAKAVKLNRDNPAYYYNLGIALVHQFDLMAAQRAFSKAIEMKPEMMQAHYQLGVMYEAAGAVEGALKEYQAVIAYGNEGEKEVQEAKSKLEGLKNRLSVNEESKGYSLVANFLFLQMKDKERAAPLFLKAVELDPRNGDYWYDLGIYYESLPDQEKAETAYRKAIEAAPNFSKPYFYLGLILEIKGEAKEAYQNFKKAQEYEVVKTSKEAESTNARIRFYEEKIKGSVSVSPFLYDNNPANSERPVSEYAVAGSYNLNLRYYYYKSLKALISSVLNLSGSFYYYSQLEYSADSFSFDGYWPDWNGVDIGASSSFGITFAPGGISGWNNATQGDFTRKLQNIGTMNSHIGYTYSISQINPFYNSTRANFSWSLFREHFGPGSLTGQFGVANSDMGIADDSNLSWIGTLIYGQTLPGYLKGSLGLGYGEAYFKNPDSFAQREGMGSLYRKNNTLTLSASLSYPLYRNLSLSFRSGWEKVNSSLSTFADRNVQDILTQLTSSIGSYSKITFGTTISYAF